MVKGHFRATDECILSCYDSYFRRCWYNEEAYIHSEGFEQAYEEHLKQIGKLRP